MDTDDAVAIPLRDGRSLSLLPDELVIRDQTGAEVVRIAMSAISGISRGGSDVVITCRATDPVTVTAATVADAARLVDAVRQQQVAPHRSLWWKRSRRG